MNMKIKKLSPEDIMRESRNLISSPDDYLNSISHLDLNRIEEWSNDARNWGYIELPAYLQKLLGRIGKCKCCIDLYSRIIEHIHFPSLQCRALFFGDQRCFLTLVKKVKSNSSIWAILEIFVWRFSQVNSDTAKRWLEDVITPYVISICDYLISIGKAKQLQQWVFADSHRTMPQHHINSKIMYLFEANIVGRWEEVFFDENSTNLDYLTFVANDINSEHPLSRKIAEIVYKNFYHSIISQSTFLPLDLSKNECDRMIGFANVFNVIYSNNLIDSISEFLNKNMCSFEGWSSKVTRPDFKTIGDFSFFIGSFCELLVIAKMTETEKRDLGNLLLSTIKITVHLCADMYVKRMLMPVCLLRLALEKKDLLTKDNLDTIMIQQFREITFVLKVLSYTRDQCTLSQFNRELLNARWNHEKVAIKARLLTTQESNQINDIKKFIEQLGLDNLEQ